MSQTVQYYDTVSFSVTAASDTTMSYQWRKDGVDIPGATMSTYTIAHATLADQGAYSVFIVNATGNTTSSDATLTVNTPPSITTQPQSKMVAAGQTAQFSIVASGSPTLTYHWRLKGVQIASATSSALVITNVQTVNTGAYTVVVINPFGSVTSSVATLSLGYIPTIGTQPQDQYIRTNDNANFSVSASGTATLKYQWRFGGVPISGATKSTLSINNAQGANAGAYNVVITNSLGAVTSAIANIYLGARPSVTNDPQRQTVVQGQSATFSVGVGGTAPFSYQWVFKGNALPGATNSTLMLLNVQPSDAGAYAVQVWNAWGSDTSNPANLVVNTAPIIQTQPQDQSVVAGQPASFSVVATGMSPLRYQWSFNGASLVGATASTLSLTNVGPSDAGNYSVVITNALGVATSSIATLTVSSPVVITPPTFTSAAMNAGGYTVQLSVSPGNTCIILASTDLQTWIPIATNVAAGNSISFTDTDAPNYPARFYRALVQ